VKLQDFAILADENIHPDVVAFLRASGCDVLYVRESLIGSSDDLLMRLAFEQNRVVVTHDKDFGALAIARREPMTGVIFLRPGHIDPKFTRETMEVLFHAKLEVEPPFMLVAKRQQDAISIRLRNLPPSKPNSEKDRRP
jgi:predicted nuclease of predicted toxin-antitoxin system